MIKIICTLCGFTILINDDDIKIIEETTCDHKGGYKVIYKKVKRNEDEETN